MQPKIAVVSGSSEYVARVQPALAALGFDVSPVASPGDTVTVVPGTVDCYVQLPQERPAEPGGLSERLGGFLALALVDRCQMASLLGESLRVGGTVVLVAGDRPARDLPDDSHARFDLLRVLGDALQEEYPKVRVTVVGPNCTPADIAAAAAGARARRPFPELSWRDNAATFVDWRSDLLSHCGPPDWEQAIYPAARSVR
jgi:hypothetical protein